MKNSLGLIEDATDSGLNPLSSIQNTGKKKARTRTQVNAVTRVPRSRVLIRGPLMVVVVLIGYLLP